MAAAGWRFLREFFWRRFLDWRALALSDTMIRMRTSLISLSTVCLVSVLIAERLEAAGRQSEHGFAAGLRIHRAQTEFEKLPFDNGDLSYGACYEYHDGPALWQLAVLYARAPGPEPDKIDYIVTPQANLVFKDRIWRGGVGLLGSYIRDAAEGGDWTDIYWQVLLGIEIPIGRLNLGGTAYHVFDKWGNIGKFKFNELEYGLWVGMRF